MLNQLSISADEQDHQTKIFTALNQLLSKQQNRLSFADFMQFALYQPALGYYSAGKNKIGPKGDFITAPEISSLFSQSLAKYCASIIDQLGPHAQILELGPGNGTLAAGIINYLAANNCLPQKYNLLEISADLKEQQQTTLQSINQQHSGLCNWLSSLPEQAFTGIIIANEVIDALPVNLFCISNNGKILEGQITTTNQANQYQLIYESPITKNFSNQVTTLLKHLPFDLEAGYCSEINLLLPLWFNELNSSLKQGNMIFIDYGFPREEYYTPSRNMGTLMCHYKHHAHPDPLKYIGLQDITAHVDFNLLADCAEKNNLEISCFTNQANFLIDNGILEMASSHQHSLEQQLLVSQQLQTLLQPHEMGELFKVMCINKN